jgi:segregation and condensation protein B
MGHKVIASVAGALLVTFAAVGVFASQDGVETQEDPTATETATETSTATPTAEPEATDTPEPTATPEETDDGDDDGDDGDDVHGIPDDNPAKEPNDDDECEKGETDIKTTPSGTRVMVPCHVVDDEDEHGNPHADDGDAVEEDDADDGDEDEDDEEEEEEEEDDEEEEEEEEEDS